jgi:hypothetical protein
MSPPLESLLLSNGQAHTEHETPSSLKKECFLSPLQALHCMVYRARSGAF